MLVRSARQRCDLPGDESPLPFVEMPAVQIQRDDEANARRWEIAENLHRADLTALERDAHVVEWIRLTEQSDLQSRQSDAIEPSKRADKKGHRKESGVRKAAREIGVSEPDARRALKVASLTPEAKATAVEVGLDDNRTALLQAAKAAPEDQPEVLRSIAAAQIVSASQPVPHSFIDRVGLCAGGAGRSLPACSSNCSYSCCK